MKTIWYFAFTLIILLITFVFTQQTLAAQPSTPTNLSGGWVYTNDKYVIMLNWDGEPMYCDSDIEDKDQQCRYSENGYIVRFYRPSGTVEETVIDPSNIATGDADLINSDSLNSGGLFFQVVEPNREYKFEILAFNEPDEDCESCQENYCQICSHKSDPATIIVPVFPREEKEERQECHDEVSLKGSVETNKTVALSWEKCGGLTQYDVYRDGKHLTTTFDNNYQDKNVKYGKHQYRVVANKINTNELVENYNQGILSIPAVQAQDKEISGEVSVNLRNPYNKYWVVVGVVLVLGFGLFIITRKSCKVIR